MKKINIILLIISIIIIVLGIIIGLGTSNEILNSIPSENTSGFIEVFGTFGAKIIGTMIILCSIGIDLLIWIFYGIVLLSIKIIKKIRNK